VEIIGILSLLKSIEEKRGRYTVRRALGDGARKTVLHLDANLFQDPALPAQAAQEEEGDQVYAAS
jgi:hypothetical protein